MSSKSISKISVEKIRLIKLPSQHEHHNTKADHHNTKADNSKVDLYSIEEGCYQCTNHSRRRKDVVVAKALQICRLRK